MSTQIDTGSRIDYLEGKLAAKRAELRDLATMGAVITSIHKISAVLSVVMDMAIRLSDGEVGLIMLEEDGQLQVKISWGISEDFVNKLTYEIDRDLPTECFETRETLILNDLELKDERGYLVQTVICLPIKTAKNCHGIMLIVNKSEGGSYGDEDKESLEMLLNFVAVAIDNSRLMREKLKRQKVEQEMIFARLVQETILPQNTRSVPGAAVGTAYFPAREVGGDFYEVHQLDEHRFLVVIGDVSSKGVPAALIMAAATGIMKSTVTQRPDISVSQLAATLNDLLVEGIIKDREMFITLFLARFDLETNTLTYCNGGHVPGLYWDGRTGSVLELAAGGPIVGQIPGIEFREGKQELSAGSRLFLFTDGLTEAENAAGELFGRKRAQEVFTGHVGLEPDEFCQTIKKMVDTYRQGSSEDSYDDFTILQVKVE